MGQLDVHRGKFGRETSEFPSAAGTEGPPRILLAKRNLVSNGCGCQTWD